MERVRSDNLIVGLGATGQSVARYLLARGMSFAVTDTRSEPPACDDPELARILNERRVGPLDGLDATGLRRLIVSPGVALEHPAIAAAGEAGAEITGDIDLFAREAAAPVIAITGSNGKSTVTALTGELLDAAGYAVAIGGNYGTPALDLLERDPEMFVLELSSFQLERCHDLAPAAAVVLNLSPDHLDRYADMAAYLRAKQRVFRGAARGLVNRDDPMLADMPTPPAMQRETFGLQAPPSATDWGLCPGVHEDGPQFCRGDQALLATARLRLRGHHNWANALAALGLVWPWLDAPERRARALAALADFPGLPHRSQWIASIDGVDWINDSKGTNLGATMAALRGTPGPLVLIAGGQAKGQDFSPLADQLAGKVRGAVLLGEDAPLISRALSPVVPVRHVADMDAAVACAAEWARPGDSVLLSPACASLDMYSDYRARGDDFARAVRERAA